MSFLYRLDLSYSMEPEQMVMTASTLYEAVEPHVVWKQLLAEFVTEITADGISFEVRGSPDVPAITSPLIFRQFACLSLYYKLSKCKMKKFKVCIYR